MGGQVEYAGTCFQGLVRKNNEDNFWCDSRYLESENHGLEELFFGVLDRESFPAFAVFDGMGGEECGEVAAYLATDTFGRGLKENYCLASADVCEENENSKEKTIRGTERIRVLCQDMNDEICRYASEHGIHSMGSTAALLFFLDSGVYAANVGDSSIFCFQDHRLKKVSLDHVCASPLYRKPPLTQYLGIPSEEMLLSPHIQKLDSFDGTLFLLCSDGLTDLFKEEEIEEILDNAESVYQAVDFLKKETLRRGALDNTTMILCRI